jgi:signal transduction histidine kinase
MSADLIQLNTELLEALTEAMTELLRTGDPRAASGRVLRAALQHTESQYGFAGVTDGRTLRMLNHEGVVWHDQLNRDFYEHAAERYRQVGYLEFTNFNNLFGQVLLTGHAVISNEPSSDPRAGGLPPGHPPLHCFLGVPILSEGRIVGMIGVANRTSGYGAAEQHRLEVLGQMAGVMYDVYGRQQREAELEEHLRQAQKMGVIGRLAGGIAHDFTNQLTIIKGCAQFLLEAMPADDPGRKDVERISATVGRGARLVCQLLAFVRQEGIHLCSQSLADLVNEMAAMIRPLLGEQVLFHVRAAPGLWRVRVDPGQIEQVIMNLVVNARDAMVTPGERFPAGTLTVEMANVELDAGAFQPTVERVAPGPYVMLVVSDTGSGMTPEVKRRIFEPFFTSKGTGTGLGLSTVFGIAKQYRGYVFGESEPGRGSTFRVYLPRAEDEEKAPAEALAVTTAPGPAPRRDRDPKGGRGLSG